MKVQLEHTSFRLRDDTESITSTPGAIQFLTDHNVPFKTYTTESYTQSGVLFKSEDRLQWHENDSTVEIPCSTVIELQKYCEKYNAKILLSSINIVISFM